MKECANIIIMKVGNSSKESDRNFYAVQTEPPKDDPIILSFNTNLYNTWQVGNNSKLDVYNNYKNFMLKMIDTYIKDYPEGERNIITDLEFKEIVMLADKAIEELKA